MDFDLVATSARRILVAFAAAGRVEQGTEACLGGEHAVEHDLSPVEPIALRARQPAQGITGLHRLLTAHGQEQQGEDNPRAGHRAPTSSFSTRSATSPAAVRRPSARTTSPGFRSASRGAAPAATRRVVGAVFTRTTRRDIPTPVISSSVPALALTARTVRSEEHTSELQSQSNLVCRLLLEKKKKRNKYSEKAY